MTAWRLRALVGVAVSLLPLSSALAGPPRESRLLFLGNQNIPPVVYLDGAVPSGVAVDVVRALAKHLPQPVEIRAMDWAEAQALVARGEADALIQINETEERGRTYDFSDPLLESRFSIFARTNRVGISGVSSLRGLRVGVEAAGLPRQVLEKDEAIWLVVIPGFLEGFRQLNQGHLDAVVVDYRVGSYVLAENDLRDIRVVGEPVAFSNSAFAVKKGNRALLDAINGALGAIRADGTYQAIMDRWEPKEVVFQTREQITRRTYYLTVSGLLALVMVATIWMSTLRHELVRRRAAEETAKEQYSTLRSIIGSANALIFSVDRQYRYTSFNEGHAATMKALYGEEIELGHAMLDYMTVPGDRETARRNLDRALAGERLVEEAYSGKEPAARRFFQVSHSPIKTGEDVVGVAVLAQDLTDRKRSEEEVRQVNQELEGRVAARTAQLEAANKELEAFAYSVAHDLRAPLRHIDGFLGLLKKELAPSLDGEGRRHMDAISAAALRMATLIDDLLSFSRMGRQGMSTGEVDLADLVKEVIRDLEPETQGRTIAWRIAELPVVTGDRAMLRMVLVNLVANALKFTRTRAQAEIEIGFQSGQVETVVFVRDNGVGFDMRHADKLFGVFQRLHAAEDFSGTGIGLASVRQIIGRHGGRTWAEGKVDGGATISFSLPRSPGRIPG